MHRSRVFLPLCNTAALWANSRSRAEWPACVVLLRHFWYAALLADDIPTGDNAVLPCSLGQKRTDRLCQVFSFEHQSTYLTIHVSPHPRFATTPFTRPVFFSFFFFFPLSLSCLEEKGSCNPTERHWSLSTASADKPASHSALAGGMGRRETRSSLAGSQQSLPAPSWAHTAKYS